MANGFMFHVQSTDKLTTVWRLGIAKGGSAFVFAFFLSLQFVVAQATYPIVWTGADNVTVNGDNSITGPLTGAIWTGGAVSKNLLAPGVDGYVEFIYPGGTTNRYMVGLSKINTDPNYASSDVSVTINGATVLPFVGSASQGTAAALAAGDVIRLAREGTLYRVFINGTFLRNLPLTVSADYLRVDVSMAAGTTPTTIKSSFAVPLLVTPQIQHPSLTNNDGSISLQLDGQTNPVTYSWSSGENTSTISGKSRGAYTVTVTDALGKVFTQTYTLAYATSWTNQKNIAINADNSLTKSVASATWNAGASSLNTLPASTNGWIEFVVGDGGSVVTVGLSRIEEDETQATIDYGWYLLGNNLLYYAESGVLSRLVAAAKGDVVRLAREGALIRYYLNGVLKRSIATTATVPLEGDVSIYSGSVPAVSSSFDKQIRVLPTMIQPNSEDLAGGIALSVQGAYTPYTISWSSGETSAMITNKARGKYTVTVTDAGSRTFSRSYRLGYPVLWTDFQNASVTYDNAVYKVTGDGNNTWDAAALSTSSLAASTDGWIEFVMPSSTSVTMIGFSRMNTSLQWASIEYGIYCYNNEVRIVESGTNVGIFASQVEGSVFAIAREGGFIRYYVNGTVVRSVATNNAYQLFVDTSIYKGKASPVTSSFSRIPQTFYAIADGAWNTPGTWSLAEGGTPSSMYPAFGDVAVIKSNTVTINSGITLANIKINAANENCSLRIDGPAAILTVMGTIELKGDANTATAKALSIINNGRVSIQSP